MHSDSCDTLSPSSLSSGLVPVHRIAPPSRRRRESRTTDTNTVKHALPVIIPTPNSCFGSDSGPDLAALSSFKSKIFSESMIPFQICKKVRRKFPSVHAELLTYEECATCGSPSSQVAHKIPQSGAKISSCVIFLPLLHRNTLPPQW